MPLIYSFDVFDTVLVRRVALPSDIFRLVALELGQQVDTPAGNFIEDFVSARIAAERIARSKVAPREDCTIRDIWRELRALMPALPSDADERLEVEIERRNIGCNPHLFFQIGALRQSGARVIFISDIYYSREDIFGLLEREGLAATLDEVYVSADVGLLKSSGALFNHVALTEGVAPADIEHLGDNWHSDVVAARRAGLRSTHYRATRLNDAEQAALKAFDGAIAGSRLAAAMRLHRLTSGDDAKGTLVSTLLGPWACLIAAWALEQAHALGIQRLYFVARDGFVPFTAAHALADAKPGIDVRYTRISRHALVAALPRLGAFGEFWIERSWSGHTLAQIAELCGHDWEEIAPDVHAVLPGAGRNDRFANREEISRFVEVLDKPRPESLSSEDRASRRRAVLAYLDEQGMRDGNSFLLVDVGWYLNMQSALKALLDSEGDGGFVGGLYLGLCNARVSEMLSGPARALLYEQPHSLDLPPEANLIFDRITLVEHLLGLAPHGTAKGYRQADGVVQVIEGAITAGRIAVTETIRDEVRTFAKMLAPFSEGLGDADRAARAIAAIGTEIFARPERYDLSELRALATEDDSRPELAASMDQPWSIGRVAAQAIPYRLREKLGIDHGPTLWPEASLAASGAAARLGLLSIAIVRRAARWLIRRRQG